MSPNTVQPCQTKQPRTTKDVTHCRRRDSRVRSNFDCNVPVKRQKISRPINAGRGCSTEKLTLRAFPVKSAPVFSRTNIGPHTPASLPKKPLLGPLPLPPAAIPSAIIVFQIYKG